MNQTSKTKKTFKDKWENNPDLYFKLTLDETSEFNYWILNRNGFKNGRALENYLSGKKRILDAGCGNGRVTAVLRRHADLRTEVVAIDLVPIKIAEENLKRVGLKENTNFYNMDLMADLKDLGKFDFIYCQEVLHHTQNPYQAFHNLVKILAPGGEIAIYVYKRKAPIREYVDDYIRERISQMPYNKAMGVCDEITEFAKVLSRKKIKIKVPKVEILGIEAGEYDFQRFIYHFFMKCYWRETLPFKANSVVNYDWYHPQLCTRHTVEEIRGWFKKSGLKIVQEFVDLYGITMRGKKL